MILSVVLTLEEELSGNAFMTAILSSQIVLNVVNATIVGGVYELTSWLPAVYLQVLYNRCYASSFKLKSSQSSSPVS